MVNWTIMSVVISGGGLALTFVAMILGIRRQNDRQHRENSEVLGAMRTDIAVIKAELRPIADWWNRGGGGSDAGRDYQR
jgi:hypothetical protein